MIAFEVSTELQVALAGVLVALTTLLGAKAQKSRTQKVDTLYELAKKMGDPNGHGTIVAMLNEVIERLKHLERFMHTHEPELPDPPVLPRTPSAPPMPPPSAPPMSSEQWRSAEV